MVRCVLPWPRTWRQSMVCGRVFLRIRFESWYVDVAGHPCTPINCMRVHFTRFTQALTHSYNTQNMLGSETLPCEMLNWQPLPSALNKNVRSWQHIIWRNKFDAAPTQKKCRKDGGRVHVHACKLALTANSKSLTCAKLVTSFMERFYFEISIFMFSWEAMLQYMPVSQEVPSVQSIRFSRLQTRRLIKPWGMSSAMHLLITHPQSASQSALTLLACLKIECFFSVVEQEVRYNIHQQMTSHVQL